MTVLISNPRSEDWIARNVLYMLLGLDTDMFTIHPSLVITVKTTTNFSCMHISPLCLKNGLKRFAVWGTRLNQVRHISARSVFVARFLRTEKDRVLHPIEIDIQKKLTAESLVICQVFLLCRKIMTEIDSFLRFSQVVSAGDSESLTTNPTILLDDSDSIKNRFVKYVEDRRIELILGDEEVPRHLSELKNDFRLISTRTPNRTELLARVLGSDIGDGNAMMKFFEDKSGYKEIVQLIFRICFFTQVDFTDDFIEGIGTGSEWIGSDTAAGVFKRAIDRCPGLQRFSTESLERFTIDMDEESSDVFERVRICIDCDGLIGLMIDQKTMDGIQQISRLCLKMRAALWVLNQTWHKLSRFGTKECKSALILRGKLAVDLQRTIYKLNHIIASTEFPVPSDGVQNLCDSFKRRIEETSENVLNLINNRLLDRIKTFAKACKYPSEINNDLLERIASNLDN